MNADAPLSTDAIDLLRRNVALGADFRVVYTALREAGYSDQAIAAAVDVVRPRGDVVALGSPAPPLVRQPRTGLTRLDTTAFEAYTLLDFLGAEDCERLIALIRRNLKPSPLSREEADAGFRTSRSCPLSWLDDPAARGIDEQICRTLGIRPAFGEGIQGQWYDVGQQFKPHHDYFVPDTMEFLRFAGLRGNRTWTFMVYLNDGMEGGGTRFTQIDRTVMPVRGMALFWNNLRPDGSPNPATQHSGEPVTRGHKVIITKWFRTLGDGPLFFDT